MADLHYEFGIFHDRIALSSESNLALQVFRDVVRRRINHYFRETLDVRLPKFRSQDTFAMDTSINRLDGQCSLSDSVYLQHLDRYDATRWPAAATVHRWLLEAASGISGIKPIDRYHCVRVQGAGHYCLNLFACSVLKGRHLLALNRSSGWASSDLPSDPPGSPHRFSEFFNSYVSLRGEQLRRVVRYLKAWADFQSMRQGEIMDEQVLTVLATNHYQGHAKDDVAFANTLEAISNAVGTIFYVLNPVDIHEELSARLCDVQKSRFQYAVKAAARDASYAIGLSDEQKASMLYRRLFGERFPIMIKPWEDQLSGFYPGLSMQ